MKTTCHSEVAPLKSVFLKKPEEAFISTNKIESEWKVLNFLNKPDLENAIEEYKHFERFFTSRKIHVSYFSSDPNTTLDSIYCRDASISTNGGVIVCNMGKEQRKGEPGSQRNRYETTGIKILGEIKKPGTVEGGDVAWVDEQTLAVGLSYRTNKEGIRQLQNLLQPLDVKICQVDLPHYHGSQDVFHLMSIFSPVDTDLAVVYSPLMPIAFRNELVERGYELIEVNDQEFESMGCNVLALAPRECVLIAGNPDAKSKLEEKGCRVSTYKGLEISLKGGGGPTCLTRPIERFPVDNS